MSDSISDIDAQVRALPLKPGVYRMYDAQGRLLYVGKARQLRKRVSQYFFRQVDSVKTAALVGRITDIQTTVTNTEAEALLLEQTLIKQHRPPYNILLKDDKSYPYISLSLSHPFPQLTYFRGKTLKSGPTYYGPFVHGGAVAQALNLLQKRYQVRQCDDSFFRNRSRPCLQHQIGRCSAPCVGSIAQEEYAQAIDSVVNFLEGRDSSLVEDLVEQMTQASEALDYEQAAQIRDQISALRAVQARQYVAGQSGNIDAVAIVLEKGLASINVMHVRSGTLVGHQHHLLKASRFPEVDPDGPEELGVQHADTFSAQAKLLNAFLPQFYLSDNLVLALPEQICVPVGLPDSALLERLVSEKAGRKIDIVHRVKSKKAAWMSMSLLNAQEQLASHLTKKSTQMARMEALREDLDLGQLPVRLECFDISHTAGEATVASCVVFDKGGPCSGEYRRFNIEGVTPGDDYGAIAQAVQRRYQGQKQREAPMPQVIIIDGGVGQLKRAYTVLEELQCLDVVLLSVAKGAGRKFGRETFYRAMPQGIERIKLSSDAFGLIGHIRDEAHRFAITGHRSKRNRSRLKSVLETVPGIGPKRRHALLTQFGGLQGLKRASEQELARIPGISQSLAKRIAEALRAD